MRVTFKRTVKKDPFYNTASVDRVEHCYNIVISHLRRNNTLTKTYAKFPPRAIYAAVKRFLAQSKYEPLDIAVTFETLRDFETVADFLESLQAEHTITKDYTDESLEDYCLEELTEKAEILGKQIANKNEVIVSRAEYYWLKNCECQIKKMQRKSEGWPLNLS